MLYRLGLYDDVGSHHVSHLLISHYALSTSVATLLPMPLCAYFLKPPLQGWTKPMPSELYDVRLLRPAPSNTIPGSETNSRKSFERNNHFLFFFKLPYCWIPRSASQERGEMYIFLENCGDPTENLMNEQEKLQKSNNRLFRSILWRSFPRLSNPTMNAPVNCTALPRRRISLSDRRTNTVEMDWSRFRK